MDSHTRLLAHDWQAMQLLGAWRVLTALAVTLIVTFGSPKPAFCQGSCIRAYGTPACNTEPISPVFARTGWRTTALDHITFRVAEPQQEAAFYAALMGWTVRSDEGVQVVMDIGDWGRPSSGGRLQIPSRLPRRAALLSVWLWRGSAS